ncbi:MAG: AsmA family protein [Oligoflexia bacterium]|nr:AsmA family protein [Oligoflexia bacterium]
MKKVLIGIGVFLAALVLVAVTLPFFIDANKYRPQIIKAVEENVNADLELGELSLSLWGGIKIKIEKLVLSEKGSNGKAPIFGMNNGALKISLLSLLTAKPDITLIVDKPMIRIVSGLDGKLNVSKLAKPASEAPPAPTESPKSTAPIALPFILNFDITEGQLAYIDDKAKTKTEITGFNFKLSDFGLNRPFSFSLQTALDVKQMKELTLNGSIEASGSAGVYLGAEGLEKLDFKLDADMTDLKIIYAKLFKKTDKVPLEFGLTMGLEKKNLKFDRGHFQIGDAAVDFTGTVENIDDPVMNLSLVSSRFDFEKWQAVIGPLKDFDMKGGANFNVKLSGTKLAPMINGKASLDGVSLLPPGLVQRVTDLKATLTFTKDTASVTGTSLKIGQSDLSAEGSVKNFAKPLVRLDVRSSLLDLDSMLPKKSAEQKKAEEQAAAQSAKAGGAEPVDVEKAASGPIAALKKSPVMRELDFLGQVKFQKVVVNKADVTDLVSVLSFKNLVMDLQKASAKAFGGNVNFTSAIDFKGADPSYKASGEVAGLDINAAVTSQMPSLKDTVMGKIQSRFTVNGSGLSKAKVSQTLKGAGQFKIDNGSWSALQVMKGIGEKLSSIPGAKDKLGGISVTDKFKQLRSDFNIANGKFNIVNLVADMEGSNTGVLGHGFVDFDMNLSLEGKILAPGQAPADLRHSDGRMAIPYEIGCKANAPCLKMEKPLQIIGKAYLKEEGGKAIKKAVENIGNPAVQDLLKKLPF